MERFVMRRTSILAAAVGGLLVSSSAFAAFTVTAVPATVAGLPAGQAAYDIFAKSDVAGTGNQSRLLGYQLNFTGVGGGAKFFVQDTDDGAGNGPDGIPDSVNIYNNPGDLLKSSVRPLSTVANGGELINPPAGNVTYQNVTPSAGFAQPNPWTSINSFGMDVAFLNSASLPNAPLATAGNGARMARLIVDSAGTYTLTGTAADVTTAKFNYSITFGGVVVTPPAFGVGAKAGASVSDARQTLATTGDNPTIYTLTIDFGNLGSVPASFAVNTNLTNSGTIASVGASPNAGITGLSASGATVSGTVSGGLRGSFDIALTGSGSPGDTAILRIVAIPEPATLSVLAGVGLLALRRRK
jgi:hypothetical protein